MLLSIVIPAYNYAPLLRRSIDSVLSQLPDACELIVVDDGSSDTTPQVLVDIAATRPNGFRWLRQENAGAAAARNRGLRSSCGTFVLLLDADDELLPDALSAVCVALREQPAANVILGGRITRQPDGHEKYHAPSKDLATDPCARVADYLLRKKISVSHGALVVRRELLEKRPYPEQFRGREDIPVFAFLLAYGNVAILDRALVRIYKHRDSLRHSGKSTEDGELALAEEIFNALPDDCRHLKQSYLALRYLALFRTTSRVGGCHAREYLFKAAHSDFMLLLRPDQVRKIVKACWGGLFR